MTSNHRDSDSNVTFHIPPNFLMLLEQIGYKVINNTIDSSAKIDADRRAKLPPQKLISN